MRRSGRWSAETSLAFSGRYYPIFRIPKKFPATLLSFIEAIQAGTSARLLKKIIDWPSRTEASGAGSFRGSHPGEKGKQNGQREMVHTEGGNQNNTASCPVSDGRCRSRGCCIGYIGVPGLPPCPRASLVLPAEPGSVPVQQTDFSRWPVESEISAFHPRRYTVPAEKNSPAVEHPDGSQPYKSCWCEGRAKSPNRCHSSSGRTDNHPG